MSDQSYHLHFHFYGIGPDVIFQEAHRRNAPWQTDIMGTLRSRIGIHPALAPDSFSRNQSRAPSLVTKRARRSPPSIPPYLEYGSGPSSTAATTIPISVKHSTSSGKDTHGQSHDEEDAPGADNDEDSNPPRALPLSADPDSYLYAKRKLKKAVSEHYKGLEVLHNYRVLNITGFRKALKKFEKVTRIPVQDQYMTNKVEKSAFASDKAVKLMMDEMEALYAAAFSRGNRKRARKRLRGGYTSKNHHFSTFRSGLFIGVAIPAFIDGFVRVFQPHTREAIPHWDDLLFFFGVLWIPMLFSLLVGFNLLVWANSRINYAFIFELDVTTQLDHREYFELPSMLLASLMYAFWLSFSLVGYPTVSPTTWPLVWLAFAFILLFEPLPVTFRSSRYWLIKIVARLFVSGTKRVEFTDFWMGDQFCSLIFTISNLFFFVCTYADNFSGDFNAKCSPSSGKWPIAFALASIPLVIRLVQSVKRFADSGLITHLINGGKYGCGVIAYLFYFMWRHNGLRHGPIFALWILTNVIYSSYALTWDLLMDWSVLRMRAKALLLRPELVYTNHTTLYYFAIISNTILRFIWVIYIPSKGPNMMLRTFIGGFLEMLRRWQWNFFRLENEHLGNMDQYRVTREVPLPYAVDDRNRDADDKDEDDDLAVKKKRN
jgi:hypothetical protein